MFSPLERFFAKVQHDPITNCWNWTACRNNKGRGMFRLEPRTVLAHRFSYEIYYGDPGQLHVCHRCDNPLCVNPAHLFVGTDQDNRDDCVSKKRHTRGEAVWKAKLNESDVANIRARYTSGVITQQELAAEFGVGQPQIHYVVSGKHWK